MQINQLKLMSLIAVGIFATACNDVPKEVKTPEPVDIEATEKINDKLLASLREISNDQRGQVEEAGKQELERLSEADRQALIGLTIDESADAVSDDANKMVELLEDINGIESQ